MIYAISTIVILIIVSIFYIKKQQRLKEQEHERIAAENEIKRQQQERELNEFHTSQKIKVISIISEIDSFDKAYLNFKDKTTFISNYDLFIFKVEHTPLYEKTVVLEYKHLPNFYNEIKKVSVYIDTFNNLEKHIDTRNTLFIKKELELSDSILSNVEGKSLDSQQRKAILTNQDNNLIIAGAGSGKTTTIAGKVKYLTQRLKIKENRILLISFTRKSAEEMADRINNQMNINVAVKTFHKLGLDIIAETSRIKPSILSLQPKEVLEIISSFIKSSANSKTYSNQLLDFLSYYLKPYKPLEEFKTDAEHNDYLKEQKLEGYKVIQKTTAEGIDIKYRERFKSQEEVLIANFLFRNQIDYEYEEKYQYKTASKMFGQYKPDFFLPKYNVYIEHFGINKKGKVPIWFKGDATQTAQQKYAAGINWKRSEHLKNKTNLIETYSWEQSEGVLLQNLTSKLNEHNVLFKPLSDNEMWKYINKNIPEDVDVFSQLINTFLVLFKSNNENITELIEKAEQLNDLRALQFLQLFGPIFENYEDYLREKKEIDFSDMINLATNAVSRYKFNSPYEYIIIDEFQDISKSRYELIKALLEQKPDTKLFCVGDDWQSIYRFAGSDIGVFTSFSNYFCLQLSDDFKRKTNVSLIENTYRFDNKLIEVSTNFILKNPNQINKKLKTRKRSKVDAVTIHKYNNPDKHINNQHHALDAALKVILKAAKKEKISILILGRYDFEKKCLEKLSYVSNIYNNTTSRYEYIHTGNPLLDLRFMTVHSAKGLEADYVIILNGNSGTYGFPSEISDDPLLNFLLSKADQFPNGEERRLFYVALTRARKHVHILSSIENPSKFITEISENEPITELKCEWCDNGRLIERKGPYGQFYSCNNNHYCNFTKKIETADLTALGEKFTELKDYNNAIIYLKKVVEIDKLSAKASYDLAKAYEENSQFHEALKFFDNSIKLDHNYAASYYWKASVYFDLQQYDKAIDSWICFNKLKPNTNAVNYWLAVAYLKNNNLKNAIESVNLELKINSNDNKVIKLKEECLSKFKNQFSKTETIIESDDFKSIRTNIELAIQYNLNIRFNYHKSVQFEGGTQSLRTLKPKGFKIMGQFDSLCVYGYCYLRKEERTFNIDRISGLIVNPQNMEFWSD